MVTRLTPLPACSAARSPLNSHPLTYSTGIPHPPLTKPKRAASVFNIAIRASYHTPCWLLLPSQAGMLGMYVWITIAVNSSGSLKECCMLLCGWPPYSQASSHIRSGASGAAEAYSTLHCGQWAVVSEECNHTTGETSSTLLSRIC